MKEILSLKISMPCIPPKKNLQNYNSKQKWRYKKENSEFIRFKNDLIMWHQKEIACLRGLNEKYKEKLFIKVNIIITKKMSDTFAKKKWVTEGMVCNQKPDSDNIRKSLFDAIFSTPKEVIIKKKGRLEKKIRWSGFDERIFEDYLIKRWSDNASTEIIITCFGVSERTSVSLDKL